MSNYVENILDDEDDFKGFRSTIRKIESPAMQQVRKKTIWSDEELDNLLNTLSAGGKNKKACMLALAMCSGRRKAELCRFRVDDFKERILYAAVRCIRPVSQFKRKGLVLESIFIVTRWPKNSSLIWMLG